MRLHRPGEVPQGVQEVRYRQSRLMAVVGLVVWCIALATGPFLGWHFGQAWVVWVSGAAAAVVMPLILADVAARFGESNWLMLIRADGVWINLRSYRNRRLAEAKTVVHLDYPQIASAAKHSESYSTPSDPTGLANKGPYGSSTMWNDVYLELRLNHQDTQELKTAIDEERQRWTERVYFGVLHSRTRVRHYPLVLIGPGILRLAWLSGHGECIRPSLKSALRELGGYVTVAAPSSRERPSWRELSHAQVDELARELVHWRGANMAAGNLLGRTRRLTPTEAHVMVEQIENEGAPGQTSAATETSSASAVRPATG